MTGELWRCAGCGFGEPFICGCPTDVAYTLGGRSAWKRDVVRRRSMLTRFRWRAYVALAKIALAICPEPHRSHLLESPYPLPLHSEDDG